MTVGAGRMLKMADAVIFMKWDSYSGSSEGPAFFSRDQLTFNCQQERLHQLAEGDRLWLVSRPTTDQQYYFVAVLFVLCRTRNHAESREGQLYGEFAIVADRSRSLDLGLRFPAEGLLRAFEFATGRQIKHGASIGQSLQTLRILSPEDTAVLSETLRRTLNQPQGWSDGPVGLWTKCDGAFADYFLTNWKERRQPLAFLLYDPPPALPIGAPVFIHSDKALRLIAIFRGGQFVAGYKPTVAEEERIAERERVWCEYRGTTVNPPSKPDFDDFWASQHGVRSLFLMDCLSEFPVPVTFKDYGRALGWGYPMGVGYRYLSLSQSYLLLRSARLSEEVSQQYLNPLLGRME
jgi:hypothetical protein